MVIHSQLKIFNMEVVDALFWIIVFFVIYKVGDYLYRLPRLSGFTSKWVFITGCDTGFGNETARRLDGKGLHVFAGCLTDKGATELKAVSSSRLMTVKLDVSDSESLTKAFTFVSENLPKGTGLSGLFNNAGIPGPVGSFEWLTMQHYQKTLDVNLLGVINTTATFLPLVKRAKGRIINTTSINGRIATPLLVPYCISKYGVESFSDAIRMQLKPFKVTVHIIEPGAHATNIANFENFKQELKNTWEKCKPSTKEEYGVEYVEGLAHSLRVIINSPIVSKHTYQVVDAYEHALLGCYPRARYMVGKDAKFITWPMSLLPEWLMDWCTEIFNRSIPPPRAAIKTY